MAETPYGFDPKSAKRIGAAVRRVEASPTSFVGPPGSSGSPAQPVFIQLTAAGSTSGWYNWKQVVYTAATDSWADASPSITGTNTAMESNLTTGLYSASPVKRYLARCAGYNASGNPVFVFTGGGSSLPTGTGFAKILQLVDDASPGTPGWDFLRFP